jgi:hypothetical protein
LETNDTFIWDLQQNGRFTVRSMYRDMASPNVPMRDHPIWRLKLPFKIKKIYVVPDNNIALIKDNLAKKQWKGNLTCCGCNNGKAA